jgi:Fic family protein
MRSNLLDTLIEEKRSGYKNGLYHLTQIKLAYNSNKIEGSTLTEDQTAYMFDYGTLITEESVTKLNDVVEMQNHFFMFNDMLDTIDAELGADVIKNFHRILKANSIDAKKEWFAVGNYKKRNNRIGMLETSPPAYVKDDMDALLLRYGAGARELEDILRFHVEFEIIHPFQDGNGRVGRMVMFRECLKNGVVPFIITDGHKDKYIHALREYYRTPELLIHEAREAQTEFGKMAEGFLHDSKNRHV